MYDDVVVPLRDQGYTIHVLEPPCYPANWKAGSTTPPPGLADDAKFVNEFVEKLADAGKEVVVLAHSYGGTFNISSSWCAKTTHLLNRFTSENVVNLAD